MIRRTFRRQTGRLNSLTLGLLLVAATGIYAAAKFGPAHIRNYQLENAFDDEARRAHLVTDDELRGLILRKARDIGFADWTPDMIAIERDPQARRIAVWSQYDVDVELIGGKVVTLHFTPEVDRPIETR